MKSSRLLRLLLLLQTRQRVTTTEIAEHLEVSTRTVLRDVEALSAAGVPVYAERGRHGGIVLLPGARLDVSRLDPAEMDVLMLGGLDAASLESLGLASAGETARDKIAARRARTPAGAASDPRGSDPGAAAPVPLSAVILADGGAWLEEAEPGVPVAELADMIRTRRRLRISYRSSGRPRAAARTVDPYGLVVRAGRWYLVADETAERATRGKLFALQRVESCTLEPEAARLRPETGLAEAWAELKALVEDPGDVEISIRLRSSRLDLARRILGGRLAGVEEDPAHVPGASVEGSDRGTGEWSRAVFRCSGIEAVRQLLQFADHVEVLAPPEARARFHDLALGIARCHARPVEEEAEVGTGVPPREEGPRSAEED